MSRLFILTGTLVLASALAGCAMDGVDDSNLGTQEGALNGAFCGGIAGIQCKAGFSCVDDPKDTCDPATGGADCAGICVKNQQSCGIIALCIIGYHWSDKQCRCVPDATTCQPKCKGGQTCQPCKTINGPKYFCMPAGTQC